MQQATVRFRCICGQTIRQTAGHHPRAETVTIETNPKPHTQFAPFVPYVALRCDPAVRYEAAPKNGGIEVPLPAGGDAEDGQNGRRDSSSSSSRSSSRDERDQRERKTGGQQECEVQAPGQRSLRAATAAPNGSRIGSDYFNGRQISGTGAGADAGSSAVWDVAAAEASSVVADRTVEAESLGRGLLESGAAFATGGVAAGFPVDGVERVGIDIPQ